MPLSASGEKPERGYPRFGIPSLICHCSDISREALMFCTRSSAAPFSFALLLAA